MSLSPAETAQIIERVTQDVVKQYMVPYIKENLDDLIRKHVFDALSFIYRDEIVAHVQKTIKVDLLDQFEITVKLKGN
jgi:hypothetical protein